MPKEMMTSIQKAPMEQDKLLTQYVTDKELVARVDKALIELKKKKNSVLEKKWEKEMNRNFLKEIQMVKSYM